MSSLDGPPPPFERTAANTHEHRRTHNNRYAHDWTDARIAELKELWFEGFSASECGKKLGVSRNSVIGKIHRLGLTGSDRKRRVTSMRQPTQGDSCSLARNY